MAAKTPSKNNNKGIVRGCLDFIIQLIGCLLLAWVASLLMTFISLIFSGKQNTDLIINRLMTHQAIWLEQQSSSTIINQPIIQNARVFTQNIQEFKINCQNTDPIRFFGLGPNSHSIKNLVRSLYFSVDSYLSLILSATQLIILRIATIFLFWPLIILLNVIACIDGITQRHLRKIRCGRESTLVYHYAYSMITPVLFTSLMIYILLPIFINLAFVLLPGIIGMMIATFFTTKMFKKYI